jgi:hexokinase
MSCAWKEEKCRIGLIIGTGTNACYLEDIKSVHTLEEIPGQCVALIVVNIDEVLL